MRSSMIRRSLEVTVGDGVAAGRRRRRGQGFPRGGPRPEDVVLLVGVLGTRPGSSGTVELRVGHGANPPHNSPRAKRLFFSKKMHGRV